MPKDKAIRTPLAKNGMKARKTTVQAAQTVDKSVPSNPASTGSLETLKDNIKKINKGNLFDALKRVKDMKPDGWRDPETVRKLTENIAQDIGIRVDPGRMDAFMNAFKDVSKNAGEKGPNVSVEEIAKKYANDKVDDKTLKEIKKFVK